MPILPPSKRRNYREKKPPHQGNDGSIYNNRRWRRLSLAVRSHQPLCEVADAIGKVMPAEETDHIIRVIDGGSMYDRRNLMAMSKHWHRIKTGKEAHGLSIDYIMTDTGKIPRDRMQVIKLITGNPAAVGGGSLSL